MSDTMRDAPIGYLVALPGKPFAITVPVEKMDLLEGHHNAPLYLAATPSPPVPSSVQEIVELLMPYVRACVDLSNAIIALDVDIQHIRCEAAFESLKSALTALVDERDRLKFELDGVRAMRGPLSEDKQDFSIDTAIDAAQNATLNTPPKFSRDSFDAAAFFAAIHGCMALRKITAKQLSEATGISETTLSRMWFGTRVCDAASLAALSAWAGINPASYCGVTPPPTHGIEPEQGGNHG